MFVTFENDEIIIFSRKELKEIRRFFNKIPAKLFPIPSSLTLRIYELINFIPDLSIMKLHSNPNLYPFF